MLNRSKTSHAVPINVAGSSTFGRYPKISIEKTYNMFLSDEWIVPYAGYETFIPQSQFGNAVVGRGIFTSTKLGLMIAVFDNRVYTINIQFNQFTMKGFDISVVQIGTLGTSSGVVYITENTKPQVVISDNTQIYYYDPSLVPPFQIAFADTATPPTPINFLPGYIDYHDTYILAAASNDQHYAPPASNTWRLGIIDPNGSGKLIFPDTAATLGLLQTKADNTQAVVRYPGKGNAIAVMGNIVTEPWFDVGYLNFPYQRNSSYSTDYGCLQPATITSNDRFAVWLAQNENSGPIIMYSNGTEFEKITTDGIDYLFSQLQKPADSRAFTYRQDGHVFYHINFYTDNLSLFYDFNTGKFYHACDENGNYFIADQVAFFNNQYYFVSRNNGNLYAFDTVFTTYDGKEIPRIRICKSVKLSSQEYYIANDVGFTIEQGTTEYQRQELGPIYLITQDGKFIITQGSAIILVTQDGKMIELQDGSGVILAQQTDPTGFSFLIAQQPFIINVVPRVDLSISIDGGLAFSSKQAYYMNPLGKGKNKLLWWRLGAANDMVCMFEFWGLGRFVATDGVMNIRQ